MATNGNVPTSAPAAAPKAAPAAKPSTPSTSSAPAANISKPKNTPAASAPRMSGADFFAKGRQGQLNDSLVEVSAADQLPEHAPARHGDIAAIEAEEFEAPAEDTLDGLGMGENTPEADQADEDYSWLDGLKQYKQIHDMDTAEVLAALANGEIPQSLWSKMLIPMKDGDREFSSSIEELRDNGMIRANYTRKMQEFARERDAFNLEKKEIAGMFQQWGQNPGTMLAQLEKMGLPVLEMAHMLGERYQAVNQLKAQEEAGTIPKGSADAYLERLQLKQQLEEAQYNQQRLQQTQQVESTQTEAKAKVAQLESTIKKFFGVEGIKESPGVWNLVRQELRGIWDAKGRDQDLTEQEIRVAVRAAKQRANEHIAQSKAAAPVAAPTVSAQPLSSAHGVTVNPRGKPKPMSGADFRKKTRVGGGLR